MNYNYQVAVPSYKRAETFRDKTCALLERHDVDPARVTLFTASEEEMEKYKVALKKTKYAHGFNFAVGKPGMGAIRNYIQTYYPEGTHVMNLDDDLSDVMEKISDKKMEPLKDGTFQEKVVARGFEECHSNGANLFGVYAAANAMFMKHRVAVGLYYCIGSCFGLITRHDDDLRVTLDDKEDFERTLQHFVKDGCVVRLDDITVKSKYYTEDGGMQVTRTTDRIRESAEILAARYPNLCSMYTRETTGHAELRHRAPKQETGGATLESFF